jgi:hypothetical protein
MAFYPNADLELDSGTVGDPDGRPDNMGPWNLNLWNAKPVAIGSAGSLAVRESHSADFRGCLGSPAAAL